jgi:bifunctional non-homologous end joining protein LigD
VGYTGAVARAESKPKPKARPKAPATKRGRAKPPLSEYDAKRDFDKTPEPRGEPGPSGRGGTEPSRGGRFVVQRHRARRLHYDVRFEVDGVLVSWAVPRGPSLDPAVKRLAVHVEDHPIEYLDFEGVIPAGEYGGGDVIVWDRGRWAPYGTDDPAAAIAGGELHADVWGEKLIGRFVLVRTDKEASGKEQWLMFHKRDEYAQAGWDAESFPRSVKSGRTNDEVRAQPDAEWRSDLPAAKAERALREPAPPVPEWDGPTDEELAALDALPAKGTWEFDGQALRLTNLDKVLFPGRDGEPPLTKRDLVRHYAFVAPLLLPYLHDRPVNTRRYPDGVDKPGFWQKAVPSHAPEWITRWRNEEADPGETEVYVVADRPATLAWLANYGAIELHPWTSRADDPHRPTYALIDIDPGPATTFDDVLVLARLYRSALEHLGVVGRPKISGRRGLQIWVPVAPGPSFDDTRAWVEQVSRAVGATVPELVSWEWRVDEREGRARLDYTQNAINKTLVAPFSTRPAAGAPVSVPITWDELDGPDLAPDRWTIANVGDRVASVGDPLAPLIGAQQRLPSLG